MQVVEFETKMKDDIEHIFNSFLSEHNIRCPLVPTQEQEQR